VDILLYHQFADIERDHWWFSARRAIVAGVLRRRLSGSPDGRRILDVGCGTGGMLEMLTEFGALTCGMDMSPEALACCRKRGLGAKVELRQGSLPEDLPQDAAWNVVTAFDVIEHLDDDAATLRAVFQTLSAGGLFVCTVPAFSFLWGPHDDLNHHRRRYTGRLLRRRLEEAGFRIERLTYFNVWLFPAVAAVRMARRVISGGKARPPRSDLFMPPAPINALLTRLFASEALVLPHVSFPVGVSLLALCRKPDPSV